MRPDREPLLISCRCPWDRAKEPMDLDFLQRSRWPTVQPWATEGARDYFQAKQTSNVRLAAVSESLQRSRATYRSHDHSMPREHGRGIRRRQAWLRHRKACRADEQSSSGGCRRGPVPAGARQWKSCPREGLLASQMSLKCLRLSSDCTILFLFCTRMSLLCIRNAIFCILLF